MFDDKRALQEFMKQPLVLRKPQCFFRYLELEKNDTEFRRTVNAGGFLNVSEVYPPNDVLTRLKCRDLRSGKMGGKVEGSPVGLRTVVTWDEPYTVSMQETCCLFRDAYKLTAFTTAVRLHGGASQHNKQA